MNRPRRWPPRNITTAFRVRCGGRQSRLFRILASPAGEAGALLSWLKRIPSPVLWAVWLG